MSEYDTEIKDGYELNTLIKTVSPDLISDSGITAETDESEVLEDEE